MTWFRVDANLADHPKTRRLEQLVGDPRAGWYVIRAWSWLSRFCPTGHIQDGDVTSFERACEWSGVVGELVAAFVSVGWLDPVSGGGFEWHDWDDLQGKVAEKARKERDRKREYRARQKALQETQLSRGTSRGRPALRNGTGRNGTDLLVESKDAASVVFEHWRRVLGKSARVVLDDKRRKAIEARLADGYSLDDLRKAVEGCAQSPHNMGQNDRGERYDDIELICRDSAHVERFRSRAEASGRREPPRPDADALGEALELAGAAGDPQLPAQLRAFKWSRSVEGLVGHTEDAFHARWLVEQHAEWLTRHGISIDAPPLPEGAAA